MNKYIPIALLVIGVIAVGGVFLSTRGSGNAVPTATPIVEEVAPEVPFDQRPFVSLTPRSDGHWLKLSMMGVNKVTGAAMVEYELLYTVADGRTQGVPGTVKLSGITTIDRDLLLGSESSGKFRYDEGVKEGKLTIKFRDSSGKLLGKLATDFHLQSAEASLTSVDGAFTYKLATAPKKGYFVTLSTFGVIEGVKGELAKGPYGVFTSEASKFPGTVTLEGSAIQRWGEAKWSTLKAGSSPDLGVFISTK